MFSSGLGDVLDSARQRSLFPSVGDGWLRIFGIGRQLTLLLALQV